MKKNTIFMTIFLTAICVLFGMNNVNAQISTDFGSFPDLPYDSDYVMIAKHKTDASKQFLYIGITGNNCVYSDYKTTLDNAMNITIEASSGSGCGYSLYLLNNNSWVWQRNVNVGYTNWQASGSYTDYNIATTIPFKLRNNTIYANGGISFLPAYLQGYTKVTLTANDRYYAISDISSGSIYIPHEAFTEYHGRLQYWDVDVESQPWSAVIQNYAVMNDGLFIKQDFNLSDYPGSDLVMFAKYYYLEGEDNVSYDIYVPSSSYGSNVIITPNQQGGNDFTFDYKDSNGDIQSDTTSSEVGGNPLLPEFLRNFSTNTFGLTSIIVAPLNLINSLLSNTCVSLSVPLPFVNSSISLPCMSAFYSNILGNWYTTYQYVTFGLVSYWVIIRIFNMIKDFKNPDHDEIEVLDV